MIKNKPWNSKNSAQFYKGLEGLASKGTRSKLGNNVNPFCGRILYLIVVLHATIMQNVF